MERRSFLATGLSGVAGLAASKAFGADAPGKKILMAVVAAGNRSRNRHVPALRRNFPQIELVALADVTPEILKQGLEACGPNTKGYDDYRKMLAEQREVEAVLVVTPNFLHAPVVIDALEAGKHVLVEKPMATRLADADRMIAAARKNKRVLMIGQQSRYSNAYHRMAQLIREKAIGELEYIIASNLRSDWAAQTWIYTDPKTGKRSKWRHLTYTAGSSLLEDGIHQLDVIHWLVGAPPRRIQATGGNAVYKDRETIDHAGLLIEFANEVKCNFAFSIFAPGLPNSRMMRFLGSEAELDLESNPEDGGQNIVIRRYRGKVEKVPVAAFTPEEQERLPLDESARRDSSTVRLHDAFLKAMATGEEPFASGKVGRDAIHISLAAERSLRTGRVIDWQQEDGL